MKRVLLALLFLLAGAGIADAQIASEIANGGGGGVSTAVGSGNAGRVPQFASATSLVDSKMLTSGTNSGTWTLYDSTVGSGVSRLILRAGDTQPDGAPLLEVFNSAGASMSGGYGAIMYNSGSYYMVAPDIISPARSSFALAASGLRLSTSAGVNFSSNGTDYGSADVALYRSAAGTLKVTDGSTGSGDLWAGNIGIGATAVNTTGLYVKAATGMTSNLYLEGTGGIINPVITFVDVGPTTGSITWQSPQMELRGGSGHYMSLDLSSTPKILFGDNADDAGIAWVSGSTLKITDGSTGSGGIGISDAATATVTDALILRHATSGTATTSFGTGLLFQGEDAAGNMNDMASVAAVYTDATDGSEDADLLLRTISGGTVATVATLTSVGSLASAPQMTVAGGFSITTDSTLNLVSSGSSIDLRAAGPLNLYSASVARWQLSSDFYPLATNSYNLGSTTAFVKDSYLGTSIQGTRTQAITDNAAAATFVTIAAATSNTTVGGRIFYTITAIDAGTATQIKTGTYSFGLSNIAGTVTGAGTDVLEHSQLSTGTLAPTFSINISGTNAQFQLVLDTSLDAGAEILKIEYRVQIDSGTATVTPAT